MKIGTISLLLLLLSCTSKPKSIAEDAGKTVLVPHEQKQRENITIKGLSFPEWIKGVWENTAESNTNYIAALTFNDGTFHLRNGMYTSGSKNQRDKELIGILEDENQSDSLYSIQFKMENNDMFIEFKYQKQDWTEDPVLSYSMKKNGKVVREHETSINLVFSRLKEM